MINKKKKKILNFQSFQTFFIFFLFLKQIKNFPISNIHCPLTLNLYLNHDHVFCSTNSINVIYYSSTIKLKISAIFDISLDKSCINIPLNPCFEGKKKKRNSVISKHYKDGGTRFVRGEIGLVKEFISLFSSNLLRIIKNKVKFIVKSIISFNGGSLLFQLHDENWFAYTQDLTRSTFQPLYPQSYGLRVVRQLRTRYAVLKVLRDFFLMPLLSSVNPLSYGCIE